MPARSAADSSLLPQQPADHLLAAPHVSKRKRKHTGAPVVFDPQHHKEYITGFRQRKLDRRNRAKKQLEAKARRQRIDERAERKAKQRKELNLERYETASEDESSEKAQLQAAPVAEGGTVRQYQAGTMLTTVTTAPVSLHSDSDRQGGESGEDDSSGSEDASHGAAALGQRSPLYMGGQVQKVDKGKAAGRGSVLRVYKHTAKHLKDGGKHAKHRRKGGA
ncbi:hypothetical protein WJX73_001380 [Symbiochloris irregularis]|uniref:Nucleolar protein 12 n=1 Tax=Symbiochloris irregularis TaxID=706552 RepID=A0AAW1P4C1_9CHLO